MIKFISGCIVGAAAASIGFYLMTPKGPVPPADYPIITLKAETLVGNHPKTIEEARALQKAQEARKAAQGEAQ